VVFRQRRRAIHAERLFQHGAPEGAAVDRVHDLGDHGNARNVTERIGRRERLVPQAFALLAITCCLRAQHEVREIDIPRVRRHVRALRHEAHVAQVTVVDDFPEHFLVDAVDLARGGGIHGIEQCWK